jgi:serine/threonine protein kinase, bacterial
VALAKDPNDRFPRCADLARALAEQVIPGAASSTAPTTRAPASRKPASPAAEPRGRSAGAAGSSKRWLLAATLIGVVALSGVFVFALHERQQRHLRVEQPATSTIIGSPVTTTEPPTNGWIVSPPPLPTTTTPATTQSRALPQAVVASGCKHLSTPTADPDGYTVYCARIESSDSYIWSRTPGTVPLPTDTSGQPLPGDQGYTYICQQQTGHTLAYCEYEMAHATYRGDGLDPP